MQLQEPKDKVEKDKKKKGGVTRMGAMITYALWRKW